MTADPAQKTAAVPKANISTIKESSSMVVVRSPRSSPDARVLYPTPQSAAKTKSPFGSQLAGGRGETG